MRIAYVIDGFYPFTIGGSEKRYWELGKRLAKKHEIYFITFKYWKNAELMEFSRDSSSTFFHVYGIHRFFSRYDPKGRRRISSAVEFSIKILPIVLREKFDIIDATLAPILHIPSLKIAQLAKRHRFAMIYTVHEVWKDIWKEYLKNPLVSMLAEFLERIALMMPDQIIVPSKFVKERCIQAGIPPEKIEIVPNGIDYKYIQHVRVENRHSEYDIVFAGRLVPYKRIDLLIKAIRFVKKEIPDVRVVIIGDGPLRKDLERLAKKLNVHSNTIFAGNIKYRNLIMKLKQSKIFVLPSTYEGFSIAVIEAMACGLPVITVSSPTNAAKEHIELSGAGYILNQDPKKLAKVIYSLLMDEKLRKNLSAKAIKYAKRFDWDILAERIEKIYTSFQI